MKQPLISVIVPCYNVEQYLQKCVDSLLNQTYSNLELLLVDDGSPDRCGEICDEYAKHDSRIKVIHKKNGGLSDARNAALDVMTGEYVTFVDSDDYVAPDYVESLLRQAEESNADIVVTQWNMFAEGTNPIVEEHYNVKKRIYTAEDALVDMMYQQSFDTAACLKLYKSDLFATQRFPVGYIFEDMATIYKLMMKSRIVAWNDYPCYYYMQRHNSIEGSPFKPAKFKSCMNIVKEMTDASKKQPRKVQRAMNCRKTSLLFHVLLEVPCDETEMRDTLLKEIKQLRWGVLFDSKARKKARMACLLSFFGMKAIETMKAKAMKMNIISFRRKNVSGGVILSVTSSYSDSNLVRVKAVISTEAELDSTSYLRAA